MIVLFSLTAKGEAHCMEAGKCQNAVVESTTKLFMLCSAGPITCRDYGYTSCY
jgi:hypothetical protein